MKMLKKAGAIAIAGAMVMAMGTVSALAEGTVSLELETISKTAADANGVITVTVPYTATGVDQVTLLAEIGTKANEFTNAIAYKTTAYSDQESADNEFVFKINESRLTPASDDIDDSAEAVYINVKIGGTGINTIEEDQIGNIQVYEKPAAPATPITSADVKGALEVGSDNAVVTNVFGLTNAGIMRLTADTLIAEKKFDLATQVVKIDGVEARYTVYNGVTKLVALVDTSKADHTIEIVAKDGGTTQLKYGDANDDILIDAGDISRVVNVILANSSLTSLEDVSLLLADPNGDVIVDAGDISAVVNLILDESRIPAADK